MLRWWGAMMDLSDLNPGDERKVYIDEYGRMWLIGFDKGKKELPTNWSLPTDESWEDGLERFLSHCVDKHKEEIVPFNELRDSIEFMSDWTSTLPSKVTPPCVELSTMKLRRYNPHRLCPFCKAPGKQTVECVTFGSYYEHDKTGLWAYIPFPHTLKNCLVCGGSYPEALAPGLEIKDD